MENFIISTYPLKKLGLVSVTVENPNFGKFKPNEKIIIGGKTYTYHNIVMLHGQYQCDTFTIKYTEDDLLHKQVHTMKEKE